MVPRDLEKMSVPKELDEIIANVKNRLRPSVYKKNDIESFAENFENKDKNINACSISLCVEKDETISGNALLIVSLLHPNKLIEASAMLKSGDRKSLSEFMDKPDFREKLIKTIRKLSSSFENDVR